MMHPVTKRRLRDGETAASASAAAEDLTKLGDADLARLRETVLDGALAMQSLDDLGSPEANDAAWNECLALDQRLQEINTEVARRRALDPDLVKQ